MLEMEEWLPNYIKNGGGENNEEAWMKIQKVSK